MAEANFDSMRKVHLQEKNYNSLSSVDAEFFRACRVFLIEQRQALHKNFSLDSATAYESGRKVFEDVISRREQKLILKALRDFNSGTVTTNGLASEEAKLYNSLISLFSQYKESLLGEIDSTQSSSTDGAAKDEGKKVVFISDIPQFVGVSGTLGPFKATQLATLPPADAKLLIERGIAKEA